MGGERLSTPISKPAEGRRLFQKHAIKQNNTVLFYYAYRYADTVQRSIPTATTRPSVRLASTYYR